MLHTPAETIAALEECRKGDYRECKKKCPYYTRDAACLGNLRLDSLELIKVLQSEKKILEDRIADQRHSNFKLHLMYNWALERLQKNHLNDRAHFQAWLRKHGYNEKSISTMSEYFDQYHPISFSR